MLLSSYGVIRLQTLKNKPKFAFEDGGFLERQLHIDSTMGKVAGIWHQLL